MTISKNLETAINAQIKEEFESAYLYLSMAAWFESRDLPGCARWMRVQYKEELSHGQKMFEFLVERDGQPKVPGIREPQQDWKSPLAAFEAAYAHEQHITSCIYSIVKKARDEGDYATEGFYGYFVKEQVEEEASALAVVKAFRLVGDNPQGLYALDKELGARSAD